MKRGVCLVLALLMLPLFALPVSAAESDDGWFVSGIVDGILDGLERLFVPDPDFMADMVQDIQNRFDQKFAGVVSAVNYLKTRFADLRGYGGADDLFKVRFPQGSFLYGISVNFLTPGKEVFAWVRFCVTGVFVVFTAVTCYRKVIALVQR